MYRRFQNRRTVRAEFAIEIKKCIQVTEAEKEKLELFLIAHPLVKYDMDFLRAD